MKREEIIIMPNGFGITLVTVLSYLSKRNQFIMNKFILAIIKSNYFNSALLISLTIIVMSEYLMWESQNNTSLMKMKTRFNSKTGIILTHIQLDLMSLSNKKILSINSLIHRIAIAKI